MTGRSATWSDRISRSGRDTPRCNPPEQPARERRSCSGPPPHTRPGVLLVSVGQRQGGRGNPDDHVAGGLDARLPGHVLSLAADVDTKRHSEALLRTLLQGFGRHDGRRSGGVTQLLRVPWEPTCDGCRSDCASGVRRGTQSGRSECQLQLELVPQRNLVRADRRNLRFQRFSAHVHRARSQLR